MIRTDYLRQVPIKHWLPITVTHCTEENIPIGVFLRLNQKCEEVITGYKQQRAWIPDKSVFRGVEFQGPLPNHIEARLLQGQEVEGFEWIDEPIVGE